MGSGSEQSLADGAKSFYEALASFGGLIPMVFAAASIAGCAYTGMKIWTRVNDDHNQAGTTGEMIGLYVGFVLFALLGISAVVVYWVSSLWTTALL